MTFRTPWRGEVPFNILPYFDPLSTPLKVDLNHRLYRTRLTALISVLQSYNEELQVSPREKSKKYVCVRSRTRLPKHEKADTYRSASSMLEESDGVEPGTRNEDAIISMSPPHTKPD